MLGLWIEHIWACIRNPPPFDLSRVPRAFLVFVCVWAGVLVYAFVQFFDGQWLKE